jgi:hypothetical protein
VVHKGMESRRLVSEILMGGVAAYVNQKLENRGEDLRLGAKKAGVDVRGLGLRTEQLGRWGRGLKLRSSSVKRKVHEIARQLGIDRRTIAPLTALEHGYGGAPCVLCEEFGLTGGLRFAEINKIPRRSLRPSQRRRLFDRMPDSDDKVS